LKDFTTVDFFKGQKVREKQTLNAAENTAKNMAKKIEKNP